MPYRHRIDTAELEDELIIPQVSSAAVQVVVGTAPVNLAEDPKVNEPVIAYSFSEAVKALGYSDDFTNYTICEVMDAAFRKFAVAPVIFINVLDPAVHKTSVTEKTITVVNRQAKVDVLGMLTDGLVVKNGNTAMVKDTDYTLSFDEDGYLVVTIIAETAPGSIKVSGNKIDPAAVTKSHIIGGYNTTTGTETGLEAIRKIFPRFGIVPGVLTVPKWSSDPDVATVMAAKIHSLNGVFNMFAVVDLDSASHKVYSALQEARDAIGIQDPDVLYLWPKIKIGTKVYDYSAVWPSMAAVTDANHGDVPYKMPSNEPLNASAALTADGTLIDLDFAQAELVNSLGIATAINFNGWRAWGDETAAYPGDASLKNRYISSRRMCLWYRNHFIITYVSKVDDPMRPQLVEAVVNSENEFLNGLGAMGAIPTGCRIVYNEDRNTIGNLVNGEIVFETDFTAWPPAKYILNEIRFNPALISAALGGTE